MSFLDGPRCTAIAKHTGQPCKNARVRGYPTCRFHGAGSPHIGRPGGRPVQHGRYSTRLPERLASRYQEALSDTRLLELRDEVALVDVLVANAVERLDAASSVERETELRSAYAAQQAAIASSDTVAFQVAHARLGAAITALETYRAAADDLVQLVDARRKLVESERKRHVEMQQMITTDRLMILVAALVDIIRSHEPNPTILAAISADIRGLLSVRHSGPADAQS